MFDTIEPETRDYLKKIMKSIFVGLFWMFANIMAGIFLECGFVGQKLSTTNIIFYTVLFVSFLFLIRWYYLIWKDGK